MQRRSVETIVRALNDAGARYLVAGGLAVVAHGHVRFTADLDLVLDLREPSLGRAITALAELGFRPRAPVDLAAFADAGQRARWASEKGMTVFSLFSPAHPETEVDLFVEAPFDFDRAYAHATMLEATPGLPTPFVSLADLIGMKRKAGRPQDLLDIERLEALGADPPSGGDT